MKDNHDRGRPRNGMFVAIPKNNGWSIEDLSPDNYRIQAIRINMGTPFLIINTYLPCDNYNDNINELVEILSIIRNVIDNSGVGQVIWTGDLNADFLRGTAHCVAIMDLIEELGLMIAWDKFKVDFTSMHNRGDQSYTSTIDHFILSANSNKLATDAGVLHLIDNTSDHNPIYLTLEGVENNQTKTEELPKEGRTIISWKRINKEAKDKYKCKLGEKLSNILIPNGILECKNIKCKDEQHCNDLDILAANIFGSIQEVAETCIPEDKTKRGAKTKEKKVIGWLNHVEPFRQNCLFWDAIWKSCGKPINNEVHKIMKRTRNIYHYQLKKTRKAEDRLKRENMLRTCLGMGGDIFKEIKKIRETKQTMANSIDGVENGIAEEFGKIYRRLYNSIDDEENMIKVNKRVELSINENSHDDVKRITPEILEKATCKLKPGKCDPIMRFTSDFIKNGPKELFKSLSIMYQGFVTHAHIPNELLISTLVPIVKDPLADINQSKNYRSVCLSSLSIK